MRMTKVTNHVLETPFLSLESHGHVRRGCPLPRRRRTNSFPLEMESLEMSRKKHLTASQLVLFVVGVAQKRPTNKSTKQQHQRGPHNSLPSQRVRAWVRVGDHLSHAHSISPLKFPIGSIEKVVPSVQMHNACLEVTFSLVLDASDLE